MILIARRYFITGSVVRSIPASVAAAVRSASTVTIVVEFGEGSKSSGEQLRGYERQGCMNMIERGTGKMRKTCPFYGVHRRCPIVINTPSPRR